MNNTISVIKRNGDKAKFDEKKIRDTVKRACKNLKSVDSKLVIYNAEVKLYDGVTTKEIDESLIKSARALVEEDPEYKYVAARLLLFTIYKSCFGQSTDESVFDMQYKACFKTNLDSLIKEGIVNPELKNFDFKRIVEALDPSRDELFAFEGLAAVAERYLFKVRNRILETPQAWLMRVAMGLSIGEKEEDRTDRAIEFYEMLSTFSYMCSTPTLFYSGSTKNQLSSCFLNTFEDSIFGIFDGLHQEAQKSKFAGGLGMDLTPFRAGNAYINGTNGYTQGAVFFWKLFNDMLVAVNQGGKRRGAGCGYLETWHYDIEDFIVLRKNVGDERRRTHDMNTANWIPDLFMKQVNIDGPWYLFSPDETPDLHSLFGAAFEARYWEYVEKGQRGELSLFKEVKAKDLWKKMLAMLFETGHPWITFKDPCNVRYTNQHVGVVNSSNLCTEITLHSKATKYEPNNNRAIQEYGETAVCNLGSINLKEHLIKVDGKYTIDYDKLVKTIKAGARMLDNVIDINFYPTQEAKNSNVRHRPVGMGSMGWHDLFIALDINYDSNEAVELSDKLYEFISYHTILASSELAKERGKYSTYEGSLWSKNILPIDTYRELIASRTNKEEDDYFISRGEELDWSVVRNHIKEYGMRNSNTMAIAPTATISQIVGCSSCTEPYFNVLFVRSVLGGDFTVINEWFVNDMKSRNIWNHNMITKIKQVDGDLSRIPEIPADIASKYRDAFNMDQFQLLKAATARGKWIDMGMSVNLFNNKTSTKYLHELYTTAWNIGLKTTYYLRNKSASQVEKASTTSVASFEPMALESLSESELESKVCRLDDPTCQSCQ
jgi:ribonucleoside-diphosphate reductase, alpha subunit